MSTPTHKILGTSDDVTACDCCGRTDLKFTVALDVLDAEGGETGDVVHFGCVCAARALGRGKTAKDGRAVESEARQIARDVKINAFVEQIRATMPLVGPSDLAAVGVKPLALVTIYTFEVHGIQVRANDANGRATDWIRRTAAADEFPAGFIARAADAAGIAFMDRVEAEKRLHGFRGRAI